MKTNYFLKLLALTFALTITSCQENGLEEITSKQKKSSKNVASKSSLKKKVLVVGFDGIQFEKISETSTPNLDKLNIVKAYAGGIDKTASEQKTSSGPGWTTILTGVWVNKHGVADNSTSNKSKVKSVFELIKNSKPNLKTASVVTWAPIHDFFRDKLNFIDYHSKSGGDENSVIGAIHAIKNEESDFVFVHLDDVDGVGHSLGFGNSYNKAIMKADEQFGRIVAEIEKRTDEDWLIMVVTDHGRGSGGYNHGGQTTQEKTIFVGMNKVGNEEFTSSVSTIPNKNYQGIYGYVAQTAIVPSVLTHLGISIQKEWQLNSTSLIGNVGVRKVMMHNLNTIYWSSNSSGNVEIYKNNSFLSSISASQGLYTDLSSDGSVNYTLMLNGQSGSVALNNSKIIAGLDWNDMINNRAYFFRSDNKYVRYNKTLDKSDNGYPKETNNSSWPGLEAYKEAISAAFKWHNNKGYFFLNDGRYIRYDMNSDSVDSGYPTTITNGNWPGLEPYKNKIIAALNWNNSKAYFFLNDGTYIRYSISNDEVDSGYPKPINNSTWPGLGDYKTKITAAVDWNSTFCYFFLDNNTYIKYSKITDSAVSGYPKPVNNNTWPGLNN
ncbi:MULTISPECIES: alkaline phosphatase family protein [unclassified Tenacibaculum]|uniref:alkaline phosphatase family protein n=1 Tax=unclassified Tenacibaculum TaxID=2635139 RepID=UPI001F2D74CB|nr:MULTISPECIES: alkaline phosphatase family protein [unclassified Tenacibaculum]MCF2874164.1 alkaline phosphatase family protein [Tenacibaculum sp. Cn5-1]MCF2934745.1 alkaline phosphatase family protein [Tenacibaculum sp. Cn5-34]MCG7510955.1 alkaline phosphatase family protein [Tenacibaculum sp. Cn5-46]